MISLHVLQQLWEVSHRMRCPIKDIDSISLVSHSACNSVQLTHRFCFFSLWVHTFCFFFSFFFFSFWRIEIRTVNTYVNEANCANDTNVQICLWQQLTPSAHFRFAFSSMSSSFCDYSKDIWMQKAQAIWKWIVIEWQLKSNDSSLCSLF